jgi:hypothetical protein
MPRVRYGLGCYDQTEELPRGQLWKREYTVVIQHESSVGEDGALERVTCPRCRKTFTVEMHYRANAQ